MVTIGRKNTIRSNKSDGIFAKNLNNEQDNKEIKLKIIQLFQNEISKLRNILKKDRSLKQLTYITAENVIEQYLNPIGKKIKDLLTTPFILIPSIY